MVPDQEKASAQSDSSERENCTQLEGQFRNSLVVQSLSHVQLFAIPWTAACQAPLFFTTSQTLFKLMPIEPMMSLNHLTLCRPFVFLPSIFPSIRVFSSESVLQSDGQSIEASASASVLPMNIQGLFSLGLTGLIFLLSKGLSRVFSNTTS